MEYETERTLYMYHTGNALSILANGLASLGGKSIEYPYFTELIGKGKSRDTRSAADIKSDILAKLGR